MNLKEPTKKKRVNQQLQRPFPIPLSKNDNWTMHTAHLSASGTCIADPDEMTAVYSMGFFGKGSLSRGYPCFGKRRFGVPPQVRERQWKRRKRWLNDVQELEAESFLFSTDSGDDPQPGCSSEPTGESEENPKTSGGLDQENNSTSEMTESKKRKLKLQHDQKLPATNEKLKQSLESHGEEPPRASIDNSANNDEDILGKGVAGMKRRIVSLSDLQGRKSNSEISVSELSDDSSHKNPRAAYNGEIDEVVLDSTEDEEVCEIVDNELNKSRGTESQDEVCVLDDDMQLLEEDKFLDYMKFPQSKPEVNANEMLVLPDSDSDTENYLKNINPRLETEGFPVTETLQLTYEETFFLMYGLGCLQVVNYDGQLFSIVDAWKHFNEQDENFFSKYVVYHYFRSKGWVVKPGVKCSGDFMLYKKGPAFYHASYVVFIEDVDADSLLRHDKQMRSISWMNIHGINRLAQSVAKELLIVQVLWPSTFSQKANPVPLEALSEFTVRELLIRRWNPNETCETIPWEDDEDESSEDST